MRKVVILGSGNCQRQDDGLAHIALDQLKLADLPADVEFVYSHQLLPEHSMIASQADLLIFVDATQTGSPDEVRLERVYPDGKFPSPSHHLTPSALLTLLERVYGVEPEAYLATVRGASFDFGEGLTARTERLIPMLVQEISRIVEERATYCA